ncbi:diguanylate cyclase [Desulfovibrio gilichinskyi]|uniref:diguanylate cyclase n=1 Tax=Desulfovibrio gilichinskyi TaxID=1519643 RepID=A0A1X7DF18_9BACT|nr:diguanylate cyclase [Desulfovibrio gilichinskyi]SMF14309.1 response regulator receiver modulated diguanylate cyclase [Desulfovibrio gilichinskyi]
MGKVLIIDSSKATALFLKRTLEQADFVCDTAPSLEQAAILISQNKYFVGLCSLIFDGHEAGEGIDLLVANKIPAIVVTASLDDDQLREILKKNIIDYVLKRKEHSEYIVRIVKRVYNNRNTKVMVVDDSSTMRRWISAILIRQGLTVIQAENGAAACKLFAANSDIKLILTDYTMPEMDGQELTAKLRLLRHMDELSIIVLSSDENSRTAPLFLKTGANDFIHKSASIEEILCRVNSNLEIMELLEESRNRANRDFLTGMWNRRYFFENAFSLFEESEDNGTPLSVALLDIDHFKNVNDNYGHDVGDLVLKDFSSKIVEYFGEKGLCSRFGGEEFTVLIHGVDSTELESYVDGFREIIEISSLPYRREKLKFTVSIGVTSNITLGLDGMINRADVMLYEAKTSGRNKVVFDNES